jgi:hypothetical protein
MLEDKPENKEQGEEQIPSLKLEGPQAAVLREILGKVITPSEASDLASITVLEATEYADGTTFCKFHKFGHVSISDSTLSDETMDRFMAAWIAWRVKHYKPPVKDDGGLDDHPF